MKKIIATLLALAVIFMASFAMASPASAGGHNYDGKKQTICHFTSENASHQYNKIEVDVNSILNGGPSGHTTHDNGADIIPPFDYYYNDDDGEVQVGHFAGQGDQTLLAFPNCERPVVDEELVVPSANYADPCGTKNDVFTVADGRGYSVGPVVQNNDGTQSITVTADDGFTFPNAQDSVTITKPGFTNVDCDLPQTGEATNNVVGGVIVLALLVALGVFLLRRRNNV